jgi:lipopolysaccharide assembly outer membrane protein LptD (OstA)
MIYIFFKPLDIEQQISKETPLFEITAFAIHELDTRGLKSVLTGSGSKKFKERYTVEDINYTDNSKKYLANMRADSGVYKNDETILNGNVNYTREDGLVFKGQEAKYNKKLALLSTDEEYRIYKGENSVVGKTLLYNSNTNKIKSSNIKAIYQLQESKK